MFGSSAWDLESRLKDGEGRDRAYPDPPPSAQPADHFPDLDALREEHLRLTQLRYDFLRAYIAFPTSLFSFDEAILLLSGGCVQRGRIMAAEEFARGYLHAPGFTAREPKRFAEEIDVILSHPRASVRYLPCVPESYVDITPQLGDISCPTLIVWGAQEMRPNLGAELADEIPSAKLATIESAGHHVNVDAPEQTSRVIEAFLDVVE